MSGTRFTASYELKVESCENYAAFVSTAFIILIIQSGHKFARVTVT